MKKKTFLVTITASVLVAGTLAGVVVAKNACSKYFFATQADNYTLNAFDAFLDNPGASVTMHTTLGNAVVLSTSGAAANGNKITLAPGGYLEVARDGEKANLNAVDGLTSIVTDFEGRILYSYRDQVASYDDAVDGTYTFPAEHAPSFFKLYNDSESTREITSFQIKYDCVVSENSISAANNTYTVENGVLSAAEDSMTVDLLQETKKGILSYTCKKVDGTATMGYIGGVVGLSATRTDWYTTGSTYVMGALNGKGDAFLGIVNSANMKLFDGVVDKDHFVAHDYVADTYTNFTIKFDVDNNYYALYHDNEIMAADTNNLATGSRLGFRITKTGDSVKNIVVQKNVDFKKEPLQKRTSKQFYVYNNGTTNVYESIATSQNAWHFFQQELPTTGTVTFDYANHGGPTGYCEGLAFAESTDVSSLTNAKSAIFGANKNSQFYGWSAYIKTEDGTSHNNMSMTVKTGAFSYTDGEVLHIRLDYDLSTCSWECYKRETPDSEWVKTGDFIENSSKRDLSGLKYLGMRFGSAHNGDDFYQRISNLVVNGVAY